MEGVHYTEKYSPKPATASIRMLLAMAAAKDGELRHFDAVGELYNGCEYRVYKAAEDNTDFVGLPSLSC